MNKSELNKIISLIEDCDNYLQGRKHSDWVSSIGTEAAKRAVLDRQNSLYDRLRDAGLNLVDEET